MKKSVYTKKQYLKAKELIKRRWGIPEEDFNDEEGTVNNKELFENDILFENYNDIYLLVHFMYQTMPENDPDFDLVESLI